MKKSSTWTLVLLFILSGCASSSPTLKAVGGAVADAGFEFLKNTLAAELTARCPKCPPATFAIGGKALDAAFNVAKTLALSPASREAATPAEIAALRAFLVTKAPDGPEMTEAEADAYLELMAAVAKPAAQDSTLRMRRPWYEAALLGADARLAGLWTDVRWYAHAARSALVR